MQRHESPKRKKQTQKLPDKERWHKLIEENKIKNSRTIQVRLGIYDRSVPDGKIVGQHKKGLLLKALFEMMYRELLSDANIKPRFVSSGIFQDSFRAVAVDEESAEFLKDRVRRMPPPWPRAKLVVDYKTKKLINVEAYIPGEQLGIPAKFFKTLQSLNSSLQTQKWGVCGVRVHNRGHVISLSVDVESYRELDRCNGFLPYLDSAIEFRVLRNEF